MFGITDTLNQHLSYTINEWNTSGYYKKVIDFLKKAEIKNFIDIGSCTGGVSDVFFENIPSLKKAVLVEAMLENYNYITERIKDDKKRQVINKALFYNKDFIELGKVRTNVGGWSYQSTENINVIETITLEDIIKNYKNFFEGEVEFIKIDIEGAEYNFIENSILLKNIPFIEIEFHTNREYGIDYTDEFKFLSDTWGSFVEKHLPNHTVVCGGKTEKFLWPNGEEVIYDGSALLVLKSLI